MLLPTFLMSFYLNNMKKAKFTFLLIFGGLPPFFACQGSKLTQKNPKIVIHSNMVMFTYHFLAKFMAIKNNIVNRGHKFNLKELFKLKILLINH